MYAITRQIGHVEITLVSTKDDVIERVIDFESVVGLIRQHILHDAPTSPRRLHSIVQDIIRRYEEYHEGLEIGMRATKVRILSNASTERLLDNRDINCYLYGGQPDDEAVYDMVSGE